MTRNRNAAGKILPRATRGAHAAWSFSGFLTLPAAVPAIRFRQLPEIPDAHE
jgi:hypothetical protein